ncbi:MAG: hypothetical protein JJU32_19770 [Phormidium sp. BM_Day4_Bin.17]|nr:hypothetical protein [Phormidium sp. BM_Day4_Bin.17]MCC5900136.1 hypothetical protein [Phormidium sp. BM_Day4_Bin.17]UCJ10680.1 MAG: hypothetical protein JWS08_12620 [Phormidium sp. PBR-2020]UCJ10682.1 MAG: hypothetical protein JWS08_12630 [Phormidium sp. PBR-2020]
MPKKQPFSSLLQQGQPTVGEPGSIGGVTSDSANSTILVAVADPTDD